MVNEDSKSDRGSSLTFWGYLRRFHTVLAVVAACLSIAFILLVQWPQRNVLRVTITSFIPLIADFDSRGTEELSILLDEQALIQPAILQIRIENDGARSINPARSEVEQFPRIRMPESTIARKVFVRAKSRETLQVAPDILEDAIDFKFGLFNPGDWFECDIVIDGPVVAVKDFSAATASVEAYHAIYTTWVDSTHEDAPFLGFINSKFAHLVCLLLASIIGGVLAAFLVVLPFATIKLSASPSRRMLKEMAEVMADRQLFCNDAVARIEGRLGETTLFDDGQSMQLRSSMSNRVFAREFFPPQIREANQIYTKELLKKRVASNERLPGFVERVYGELLANGILDYDSDLNRRLRSKAFLELVLVKLPLSLAFLGSVLSLCLILIDSWIQYYI